MAKNARDFYLLAAKHMKKKQASTSTCESKEEVAL
jgi:hypothetical protein